MLQGWKVAGALGLGAALVYVLDHTGTPNSRRQRLARGVRRNGRRWVDALRRGAGIERAAARRLAGRVRARIAHAVSEPRAIDLQAEDGRVILRGPVPSREVDSLLDAVWRTPGVDQVDVRLELLESTEELPVLPPEADRVRPRFGPGFQVIAVLGVAGAGLTVRALLGGRPGLAVRRAS